MQKKQTQGVRIQQRREGEMPTKGAKTTGICNPCNDTIASSSRLKSQQSSRSNVDVVTEYHDHLYSAIDPEAIATSEDTAHNRENVDDNDYDDIINVATLSKATPVKERERFNTTETIIDHESEYGDYDDVIVISTLANQRPLESLTTYNTNPAYTTRQQYLTDSVEPPPELMTNDSPSDLDDYENADEVNLAEELLIDDDTYVKTDLDYLQLVPHVIVTSTSSNSHATAGSPQLNTGTNSTVIESPKDILHQQPLKFQLSTVGCFSHSTCVVHEYDTIELQGNVPLVVSHQGQSTPLGKRTTPTLGIVVNHESSSASEGREDGTTRFHNLLSAGTNPQDHVYDSADIMEKIGHNIKEIEDFDASATDAIDTAQSDNDPDYTFDRLSPCVYMDPEQLHNKGMDKSSHNGNVEIGIIRDFDASERDAIDTAQLDDDPDYTFDRLSPCVYMDPEQLHSSKSSEPNNIHRYVGDVNYSKLSPVTHWQGKWSQDDLERANAVYAKVNTLSKKPKPGTLDKKLGSLV